MLKVQNLLQTTWPQSRHMTVSRWNLHIEQRSKKRFWLSSRKFDSNLTGVNRSSAFARKIAMSEKS